MAKRMMFSKSEVLLERQVVSRCMAKWMAFIV